MDVHPSGTIVKKPLCGTEHKASLVLELMQKSVRRLGKYLILLVTVYQEISGFVAH